MIGGMLAGSMEAPAAAACNSIVHLAAIHSASDEEPPENDSIGLAAGAAGDEAAGVAGRGALEQGGWVEIAYAAAMLVAAATALFLFFVRQWHCLPAAPESDTRTVIIPLLMLVCMLLLQRAGLQIVAAVNDIDLENLDALPARESIEAMTILKSAEYAFALPALCAAFWWQARLRARGLRRPMRLGGALALGAGALLLAWPVVTTVALLGGLVSRIVTGEPPGPIAHRTLEDLTSADTGSSAWALIGLVVVGAAVFEEVFYRGLLQECLKRFARARWVAIIAASLFFSMMHIGAVPPSGLPALFALSLGLGWVYEKSDSLFAPILAHMGFNLLNIVLAMAVAG